MNIFEIIDDAVKTGVARWKKIEDKYNKIKDKLSNDLNISDKELAESFLLIVDHLRPMNPSEESIAKASEELKKIVSKSE
jgi:hypothetical protein